MTTQDIELKNIIPDKISTMRNGCVFVWELKLTPDEFAGLERRICDSVASHGGDYKHLLEEDLALHTVVYLAEWYKRCYDGTPTSRPKVAFNTKDLMKLWDVLDSDTHLYKNTYLYKAASNIQWQHSLRLLGGLAINEILMKSYGDPFLVDLCRLYHGEDIDLDDEFLTIEYGNSVAVRESIRSQHSLYYFLFKILKKEYPFSQVELDDPNSDANKLIDKIKNADRLALKKKFEMEWLLATGANQLYRSVKICLKPENLNGQRGYVSFDRAANWCIANTERSFEVYLRFKSVKGGVVPDVRAMSFSNTGSDRGFVLNSRGDEDFVVVDQVPVDDISEVSLIAVKADGTKKNMPEDSLQWGDPLQFYMSLHTRVWTSRPLNLGTTMVVFTDKWNPIGTSLDGLCRQYVIASAVSPETGRNVTLLPIHNEVELTDGINSRKFMNRMGHYLVLPKIYPEAIRYVSGYKVRYHELLEGMELLTADELDVSCFDNQETMLLFGHEGLSVYKLKSKNDPKPDLIPSADYSIYYNGDKKLDAFTPKGLYRFTIEINTGKTLEFTAFYIPYTSTANMPKPAWRQYDNKTLHIVNHSENDPYDVANPPAEVTTSLHETVAGSHNYAEIDMYHPVKVVELRQNDGCPEVYNLDDTIDVPFINCEQFSVRRYTADGVEDYSLADQKNRIGEFPNMNIEDPNPMQDYDPILHKGISLYYAKDNTALTTDDYIWWDYGNVFHHGLLPDEENGMDFQSRKRTPNTRHYLAPVHWDNDVFDRPDIHCIPFDCFKVAVEHRVYFTLFYPLRKSVVGDTMVADILLPLLVERTGQLKYADYDNLKRFAQEFLFDWRKKPTAKPTADLLPQYPQIRTWVNDFINKC